MSLCQSKRLFVTDCEGPISKNDNAFELTQHFIPQGAKFYALISKYDDVLADVLHKKGYEAGDTLKLILPFLKAYGVTNNKMKVFSAQSILLVPGARDTIQFVQRRMPSYIVSTSYEHYISALCKTIRFPFENTFSTKVDIDKYRPKAEEAKVLKQLAEEIASMPIMKIPAKAKSLRDFPSRDQAALRRLDEIFWSIVPELGAGRIFDDVNPVGGMEKASAVREIASRNSCRADCVMYVGDSITDVECFRLVRNNDGLAASFNGNEYAVREAEIAIMSQNTIATSILADLFCRQRKADVLELAEEWSLPKVKQFDLDSRLVEQVQRMDIRDFPKVRVITKENRQEIEKESTSYRKKVRGEAVARLG